MIKMGRRPLHGPPDPHCRKAGHRLTARNSYWWIQQSDTYGPLLRLRCLVCHSVDGRLRYRRKILERRLEEA